MVPTCAAFRAWEARFAVSVLADNKTHIVSQNKCPKLRRLNGVGCWELTDLTFPAESIPSLTAPLHPGSETTSSASPRYLTFRCDASFLGIMILTLAVTFTLSYLQLFPCKQMFEMTRNRELTFVNAKPRIWVWTGSEFKLRAREWILQWINMAVGLVRPHSNLEWTEPKNKKYHRLHSVSKLVRACWACESLQMFCITNNGCNISMIAYQHPVCKLRELI